MLDVRRRPLPPHHLVPRFEVTNNAFFRWTGPICFLNGATMTTLCIGWEIEGIMVTRHLYLLGCAAAAIFLCLARFLIGCGYASRGVSVGGRQLEVMCSTVDVGVLSALVALLYVPKTTKECLRGRGALHFCRMVVRFAPSFSARFRSSSLMIE